MILRGLEVAARRRGALYAAAIAALSALAWANRFVQDDAFISFRYARHLADGLGLVWNPGERIEGYTNFLWTLSMSVPFVVGVDPVGFSKLLSWLFFPVSLALTARIAARVTDAPWAPLAAVVLLGTNYTFSAYATGGLETQLHVCLLLAATSFSLQVADAERPGAGPAIATSLVAAGALMTRMDSVLPLLAIYGYVAIARRRDLRADPRLAFRTAAWLVLPGAVLVCAWLAWKLAYYGDVLPNTFYAKTAPVTSTWQPGLRFVWTFLDAYWLWPLALLPALYGRETVRGFTRPAGLLLVLVAIGCGYAVLVGGGFMEFRLLVPILPPLFVLLAWLLTAVCPRWLGAAVAAALVAGSAYHARTFALENFVESIPLLEAHVEDPPYLWAKTGRVLGELFGGEGDPVWIATSAAGAVPFYSGLPTVDQLGLNDAAVARSEITVPVDRVSPAHYRSASFAYLVERNVNLVIGTPWVSERDPGPRPRFGRYGLVRFNVATPTPDEIPDAARMQVIEIDLDERHRLFVLYLMPSAHVDEVVRREGLRVYPVVRPTASRPAAG